MCTNTLPAVASVPAAIDALAESQCETAFLISPETGTLVTFKGLREESIHLCRMLRQAGLKKSDKVAFLMDNSLPTVQLFLGTMYGGYVAVPLNVRAGAEQLSYMLDHCDAKIVFAEQHYHGLLSETLQSVRRDIRVISVDPAGPLPAFAAAEEFEMEPPRSMDAALLMYSSGSTGKPKGAIHTHSSILAHGWNSIEAHQLSAADRSLLVLPVYHINAECVTLMPALLSGGSVVVAPRFAVNRFWDWVDDLHVTWSALVPTIISELVEWDDPKKDQRAAAFARIRFLRSSSAPLSPSLHQQFTDKFRLPLLQAMGSTECGNIFSNPVPPGNNKLGSPGLPWGFETRIVDREGANVPQGESGEMLLRGLGLMQGYYKDPDGTAAVVDGDGWLHTGDLARQDEDGYFFVVGRSKELIIKGGMNIAPRQIDEVLESHPAVLEAAAVGVPDRYFGEDAVAFVVLRPGDVAGENELLAWCESRLGHFKTPSRIHFLMELPKGPSGKVQRLRLLDPAILEAVAATRQAARELRTTADGSKSVDAPPSQSLIEQTIAAAWAEALGLPEVDLHSNFFALGGHSLLAIQCLSRLREKLPIVLTINDFFENSTVFEQADLVRQRLRPIHGADAGAAAGTQEDWERSLLHEFVAPPPKTTIPRRDTTLPCPLSPAQERLWFLEELYPGAAVYNEAEAVRMTGELKTGALEAAMNIIVAQHEPLRSTIELIDGVPYAAVHESWPLDLEQIDLSGLPTERRETEVERLLVEKPRLRYNLTSQPGIRVALVRLGEHEHVLILMMHHMICDWSSMGIIWRELSGLYHALLSGFPAVLPPLSITHGDYAAWQQKRLVHPDFLEDLDFWEEKLRDAPPLLELPADRPRPTEMSFRGGRRRWKLNAALTERLRRVSEQEKVSLFTIFSAALNALLYRYTGSDDILLGIPLADRDQPELQSTIGFLLHTMVLRTRLAGDMTLRELLSCVQKGVLELYTHRSAPFDQIIRRLGQERSLSYTPLFQVMLIWRDRDQQLSFIGMDGLAIESLMAHSESAKFDQMFMATDNGDEIWLELEYNTDLFDEDRMVRMLAHLQTILETVSADPAATLAAMPLLTAGEREQIEEWNQTQKSFPADRCLDELIDEQTQRTPDAIAVSCEGKQLTYRQLQDRASQLSGRLRELGAARNTLIAICVERSADMVVGLLGILKAGAAYLPLDPAFPPERLRFMVEDAQPLAIVTQEHLQALLPASQAHIVCMGQLSGKEPTHSVALSGRRADDLAYVLYTSGSTGRPKGVEIQHRALVNFLTAMQDEPGIGANDTVLAVTTLSFDIAGLELYLPLVTGASIVIAPTETSRDARQLLALMQSSGVTLMQATPVTWQMLIDAGWQGSPGLRALCGGEAWNAELAGKLLERCASLWNMYGPTETTIWSSASRVERNRPVVIGRPIANTTFHVFDGFRQPLPIGIPGELYIGGQGLAAGYLGRPDLTRERFVEHAGTGQRLYRTGDLVSRLADGSLKFMRRIDHQIKLHGYRIELEEIESVLQQHPGVRQCVVTVQEGDQGEKRLVAYAVPANPAHRPTVKELRDALKRRLPGYMIPAVFSLTDELPLTANGKIDRRKLSQMTFEAIHSEAPVEPPRDAIEIRLVEIWEKTLGIHPVGIRSNFFDLGGYSLLVTRLFAQVNKVFGRSLPIATIFRHPTIEGLATVIRGNDVSSTSLVPIRATGTKEPLFIVLSYLIYERFRQMIEPECPLFGLHEREDDKERVVSFQDRVAEYARQIRELKPEGPYHLIAWCAAAPVAVELARTLESSGGKVGMLGLIDATCPGYAPAASGEDERKSFLGGLKGWMKYHLEARTRYEGVGTARYFARVVHGTILDKSRRYLSRHHRESILAVCRWFGIARPDFLQNESWVKVDRIEPYAGHITLFRATETHRMAPDPALGWRDTILGGVDIEWIPGNHETMFRGENLTIFGQRVMEALEQDSPAAVSHEPSPDELACPGIPA